jgi:hypothetical protein
MIQERVVSNEIQCIIIYARSANERYIRNYSCDLLNAFWVNRNRRPCYAEL